MTEQNPNPPPVEFKDRSPGLIVFGILTILLGCLSGLLVPLMFLGQMMAVKATHAPSNIQALIPGMFMYGAMAVVLIWLGIGSIKARRWARALLLTFSWSWLVLGIVTLIFMVIALPQFLTAMQSATPPGQPALPPGAKFMMMLIPMLMLTVFFLILPGVWIFFYQSNHVKATCETRDPVARWTDACPLPVLAVSLWLGLSALMMPVMPFTYHGAIPFFGTFISGLPGTVLYLVIAAIFGYSAWAMYKLDPRGWWLVFIGLCLFSISNIITYARHDVMELYRLMGYPAAQLEQMQKFNFLKSGTMIWGSLLFTLPFLGYLIYVKKFFRRES
jgi:hypothetical protein